LKKIAPIIMTIAIIAIIGYFDSPLFAEKEDVISRIPMPTDETASANASTDEPTEESEQQTILETKLEEITEEDGYVVEVYREYEIVKDEEGNIIDSTPTENYQYLRYKK
jgi:hypothetical protein